jgi:hypothetical protein
MIMKYECHGHIIADGHGYQASMARHRHRADEAYVRRALESVAARGVGFYRDGGDKYMVSALAKRIAGEYGIDYRTPVFIAHKTGHYGAMYGRCFDDLKMFRALVGEAKTLGADFIKLTVSGMLDFDDGGRILGPVFGGDELKEAVRIAGGEGFSIMAHVTALKTKNGSGVRRSQRGARLLADSSVIEYFLQTGAVWCRVRRGLQSHRHGRYATTHCAKFTRRRRPSSLKLTTGRSNRLRQRLRRFHGPAGKGTDDELSLLTALGIDRPGATRP